MVDDITETVETSLIEFAGADKDPSVQQLTLYFPNKDKKRE